MEHKKLTTFAISVPSRGLLDKLFFDNTPRTSPILDPIRMETIINNKKDICPIIGKALPIINCKIMNANSERMIPSGKTERIIAKTDSDDVDGETYNEPYIPENCLCFVTSLKIVINAPENEIINTIPGINQDSLET